MKMTMHIDETLLDEVIGRFGCASKTEAVDFALRELMRKSKLKALGRTGLGLSQDELRNAVDPNYDVLAMRYTDQQQPIWRVAETPVDNSPLPPLTPVPPPLPVRYGKPRPNR